MKSDKSNLNNKEQRRHPRIEADNRVGYVLLNDNWEKIGAGKGHTANLSQSGTMLKTKEPIDGTFVILVTIDLEGAQIKVKGRVRHTRRDEFSKLFLTGIEFIGPKDEQRRAIVSFVKTYQYRKHMSKEHH
jgi:c-di-GMP-binding flagellar brake protein YcgR